MASGRLIDYLGLGPIGSRPPAPDLFAGTLGLWWATDTEVFSFWDGSTWTDVLGAGVTSVNGQSGAVSLALADIDGVNEPTGGWQAGDLLIFIAGEWRALALGVPGQVLTVSTGGIAWENQAGGGDVVGPGSSVDNTLPRFVGTSGQSIEDTGIVIGDDDEISGYRGMIDLDTASTYTPTAAESGSVKELSDGAGVTVTLDAQMPKGFVQTLVQAGAGALTFSPESGATLRNRQGHTDSAGQWAVCMLFVRDNVDGNSADWVLAGDTA